MRHSGKMRRAINVNSQAAQFADFNMLATNPTGDGLFSLGEGSSSSGCVRLIPVAEGPAGAQFKIRLYGWQLHDGDVDYSNSDTMIPLLLAELRCVICERPGPRFVGQLPLVAFISNQERACNEIELLHRVTRQDEAILSYPDLNVIGLAEIGLYGCQFCQLDFEQIDQVTMNCLVATI